MTDSRRQLLEQRLHNMLEIERSHWQNNVFLIAGMDEAGRGPLAGPVVAACVIMKHDDLLLGVNDSKKLSEKRREELYPQILAKAVDVGVGIVDHNEIDRINILQATRKAFVLALNELSYLPLHIYTDAMEFDTDIPCTSIVKGDSKMYSIAAASIVAKVTRDRLMREADNAYPGYGFARHKGYGTKAHYEAIDRLGVCNIHRRTFLKKIISHE